MERIITLEACKEVGDLGPEDLKLDRDRMKFILKKKFRHLSGRKRLGLVWVVLDPIVIFEGPRVSLWSYSIECCLSIL